MIQGMKARNEADKNGNPTGGTVNALGLEIRWQDGPCVVLDGVRTPNGCFVETVIAAAKQRLEFFQASRLNCPQNKDAIYHLEQALLALHSRAEDRAVRLVEGTYEN